MHWARWGGPAEDAPLAGPTRELVEAVFGPTSEHPTVRGALVP